MRENSLRLKEYACHVASSNRQGLIAIRYWTNLICSKTNRERIERSDDNISCQNGFGSVVRVVEDYEHSMTLRLFDPLNISLTKRYSLASL
jgi:hypothetical protein